MTAHNTAYCVLDGQFGGAFLQPLPIPSPPAAEVEPGSADLENFWTMLATSLTEEIHWLKDGDIGAVDYDTGVTVMGHCPFLYCWAAPRFAITRISAVTAGEPMHQGHAQSNQGVSHTHIRDAVTY